MRRTRLEGVPGEVEEAMPGHRPGAHIGPSAASRRGPVIQGAI